MAIKSPVASVIGLFGKTKLDPIRKSAPLQQQIDLTTGSLPGYREAQNKSLADYTTKLKGVEGEVNRLSGEDTATLGNLINQGANYNPETSFKNLGDYLTGLWGNAAGKIADIGRGRVNLANAMTYGGKGGGSYGENVLLNNISRNLAPAFTTALAGITPAFQATSGDRYRNLGSMLDLIGTRAQVPFRTADLALLPAEARSRFLQDEIGALSGLGGAVNQNLAGFQAKDNWAKQLSDAGNETFGSLADLATQAAMSYMGGGMGGLGGMGGGGGGINAGSTPKPQPSGGFSWMNPQPNYVQQNPTMDYSQYTSISPWAQQAQPPLQQTLQYPYFPQSNLTYPGYANLFGPSI